MSNEERIKYWLDSAIETQQVARESYEAKHYDWAFFQWHLAIEKLLKGLMVKRDETPPYVHDLTKLASVAGVSVTDEQRVNLTEISTYNIDARYDDYKRAFYTKVTAVEYREFWQKRCEEIFVWLKDLY